MRAVERFGRGAGPAEVVAAEADGGDEETGCADAAQGNRAVGAHRSTLTGFRASPHARQKAPAEVARAFCAKRAITARAASSARRGGAAGEAGGVAGGVAGDGCRRLGGGCRRSRSRRRGCNRPAARSLREPAGGYAPGGGLGNRVPTRGRLTRDAGPVVRSDRKELPAHGAAGMAVFQRDLSKARMPSHTMLRKKYRISQTASFCSFSPTRHAARRVTTSGEPHHPADERDPGQQDRGCDRDEDEPRVQVAELAEDHEVVDRHPGSPLALHSGLLEDLHEEDGAEDVEADGEDGPEKGRGREERQSGAVDVVGHGVPPEYEPRRASHVGAASPRVHMLATTGPARHAIGGYSPHVSSLANLAGHPSARWKDPHERFESPHSPAPPRPAGG